MVRSACSLGTQVIWDLCHYGWPDDIDIFSSDFVRRFCAYAKSFAKLLRSETDDVLYFTPVNEISFFSWAAGDVGYLNPFATGKGHDLKRQLVRAAIEGMEAIWDVAPDSRFVHVDPVIHVVPPPGLSHWELEQVHGYNRAVFDGWAMICGELAPELGGHPRYLDIIGANYYVYNQWIHGGPHLDRSDPRYYPLRAILRDLYARFQRPLFIAETGIENEQRPEWLSYVCDEVAGAIDGGIPVEGICLYPIVNHPGWDDERHCHNGLWDYCNHCGEREIYQPLADELGRQSARMENLQKNADCNEMSLAMSV